METSVKQRLMQFIQTIKSTPAAFEKSVGLSNGYLAKLINCPSPIKMAAILDKYPNLNRVWLMTGEGEMLNDTQAATATPTDTDRLLAMLEEDHRLLREQLGRKDETIDRLLAIMEADRNIDRKKQTA
jgi:hypothetical protein